MIAKVEMKRVSNPEEAISYIQEVIKKSGLQDKLNSDPNKTILFNYLIHQMCYEIAASAYESSVEAGATIEKPSFYYNSKSFLEKKLGYRPGESGVVDSTENEKFQNEVHNISIEDKRDLIFEDLANLQVVYPHTREATSHPTESLSTQGIRKHQSLRDLLSNKFRGIFFGETEGLDDTILVHSLNAMYDAIEPDGVNLTPENEIARGAELSKNPYESIPLLGEAVLKNIVETYGIDLKNDDPKIVQEIMDRVNNTVINMVDNSVWALDMDGKLPTDKRKGLMALEANKLAINQQYIEDLADFGLRLKEQGNTEAVEFVQSMMFQVMGNIERVYPRTVGADDSISKQQQAYKKLDRFVNSYLRKKSLPQENRNGEYEILEQPDTAELERSKAIYEFVKDIWDFRNSSEVRKDLDELRNLQRSVKKSTDDSSLVNGESLNSLYEVASEAFISKYSEERGFLLSENIKNPASGIVHENRLLALKKLAEIEGVKDLKTILPGRKSDVQRAVDGLIQKFGNFRDVSQKVTHRESAQVYDITATGIISFIEGKENAISSSIKIDFKSKIHDLAEQGKVELETSRDEIINVRDLLRVLTSKNEEVKEVANELRKIIRERVASKADHVYNLKDQMLALESKDEMEAFFQKHAEEIYVIQTIDMEDFKNTNADNLQFSLQAEFSKPEDLWNLMLAREVAKDPDNMPDNSILPPMIPLTEYFVDLVNKAESIAEAMKFEPFAEAIKESSPKDADWLKIWDEETKSLRKMNVNDLLNQIDQQQDLSQIAGEEGYTGKNSKEALINNIKEKIAERNGYDSIDDVSGEELKEVLEMDIFSYITMEAGSDSNKSAGTAVEFLIDQCNLDTQGKLALVGALLTNFMGNGSAIHRVAITNSLIRTHQGRQMKEGAELLASETDTVVSIHSARKAGLRQIEVSSPNNDFERFLVAINNVMNRANLKMDMNAEEIAKYDQEAFDSMVFYNSFYEDSDKSEWPEKAQEAYARIKDKLPEGIDPRDFGRFIEDTGFRGVDATGKFGARAPFRPNLGFVVGKLKARLFGGKEAEEEFVKEHSENNEFGTHSMRAIGYGADSNQKGGLHYPLHLFLAPEVDGKTAFQNFTKNPYKQSRLNRGAIDAAVKFNANVFWENISAGSGTSKITRRKTHDGKTMISFGENSEIEFSLSDLVKGDPKTLESLRAFINLNRDNENKRNNGENPISLERQVNNIRIAAFTDLQNQETISAANQIFDEARKEAIKNNYKVSKPMDLLTKDIKSSDVDADQKKLIGNIAAFTPGLGGEIKRDFASYQASLKIASKAYVDDLTGKEPLAKRTVKSKPEGYQKYAKLHYAAATMKAIGESVPAAVKSVAWAVRMGIESQLNSLAKS